MLPERDELAVLGASWKADSSLEKWFPLTSEELERKTNELQKLTIALLHIVNYPVHSEPVGAAYEMQDVASKALGRFPA